MKKKEEEKKSSKKEVQKKNEKNKVKEEKEKKGNIFRRIGRYFRGVVKEIGRIRWTSGKDLFKYSVAAIAFVIFFGVYFYAIDWIALLVRSLAN